MNRHGEVMYKGVKIETYQGSNWVYVNNRPFTSMRSCKMWITKMIAHDCIHKVIQAQKPRPQLIINQSMALECTMRVSGYLRVIA